MRLGSCGSWEQSRQQTSPGSAHGVRTASTSPCLQQADRRSLAASAPQPARPRYEWLFRVERVRHVEQLRRRSELAKGNQSLEPNLGCRTSAAAAVRGSAAIAAVPMSAVCGHGPPQRSGPGVRCAEIPTAPRHRAVLNRSRDLGRSSVLGRHCSGVDCHKCRFSHVERTVAKVIATHRTGGQESRFANIERPTLRKLKQLDLARRIDALRAPPANRLESLKGDRAGQLDDH